MQAAEFGFAWFVLGKFHEIAIGQEFTKAFFLIARQAVGALEFVEKLLSGAFRSAEVEAFFQIPAGRVGHGDDERLRLRDEREGFLQLLLGTYVSRHCWDDRNLRRAFAPPPPEEQGGNDNGQARKRP